MNRAGRIDPVDGLHQGLEFVFRPIGFIQADEAAARFAAVDAKKAVKLMCEMVSDHLVSWSEMTSETDQAQQAEINAANVERLGRELVTRLYLILSLQQASDLSGDPISPVKRLLEEQGNSGAASDSD
jgi:hypothetical protein